VPGLLFCVYAEELKTCFRLEYYSYDDNPFCESFTVNCEGQEIFPSSKTPGRLGSPNLLFRGYRSSFAAVSGLSVKLRIRLNLVPRLKII
jgi:hypothetical protein